MNTGIRLLLLLPLGLAGCAAPLLPDPGPDMVAGAKVRVAAVDGTELRVEPAP